LNSVPTPNIFIICICSDNESISLQRREKNGERKKKRK